MAATNVAGGHNQQQIKASDRDVSKRSQNAMNGAD